jgi:DNA-binding response OmpR family regulator
MKPKILVVDDEETVRNSLEEILRLEGYDVRVVGDGDTTLGLVQQENFDLILLDLKMPGMDGGDVLKALAHLSPNTLVILLTGHGSLESAIEALRYGAHDYLLKPASSKELLNSVARALAKRAEQQQRKMLLQQLDASVQRLKESEGLDSTPIGEIQTIALSNGVMIDLSRRDIWRGNNHVSLTPTEGKLIKALLDHRGHVLTHRELVFMVQGYEAAEWEAPEVLRPLVSRLRRKLSVFPGGEKWIANVRGTGYLFEIREVDE